MTFSESDKNVTGRLFPQDQFIRVIDLDVKDNNQIHDVTYSLRGKHQDWFTIDPGTGLIRRKRTVKLDYETTKNISLEVGNRIFISFLILIFHFSQVQYQIVDNYY